MSHRLILICHAATDATRRGRFPLDEPIVQVGIEAAGLAARRLPRTDRVLMSSALRARQSAVLLWPAVSAQEEPALNDLNVGRWAGRDPAKLEAEEPEALLAWLDDPEACPHGGESIAALRLRVGHWIGARVAERGRTAAVTHPSVIRAAILSVLDAPAQAFWRIDVPPLSITDLRSNGKRWAVRQMSAPLRD